MKTYTGGCHCKKVRFEVDTEEITGAMACNCSLCTMRGWLLTFVPAQNFRLLTDASALTEYQFNKKVIHHLFCNTCGTASFGRGEDASGNEMIAINVRCLDDIDLDTITITPYNGKDA